MGKALIVHFKYLNNKHMSKFLLIITTSLLLFSCGNKQVPLDKRITSEYTFDWVYGADYMAMYKEMKEQKYQKEKNYSSDISIKTIGKIIISKNEILVQSDDEQLKKFIEQYGKLKVLNVEEEQPSSMKKYGIIYHKYKTDKCEVSVSIKSNIVNNITFNFSASEILTFYKIK